MLTLLLATWLALPLYPLNPIEQDTLSQMNLHVSVGLAGPSRLADPGIEASAKYEVLMDHPYVLRGGVNYNLAQVASRDFPDGDFHSVTLSADALYYRGTKALTGYLGLGVLVHKGFIQFDDGAEEILGDGQQLVDVSMRTKVGYRAIFGLRFSESLSLELTMSDVRPKIVTTTTGGGSQYRDFSREMRLQEVRLSIGYLFTLRT